MSQRPGALTKQGRRTGGHGRDRMSAGPRITKRKFYSLRDDAMNATTITKSDLKLRRVRIRVNARRVDRQLQHIRRKPTVEQDIPAGVFSSM